MSLINTLKGFLIGIALVIPGLSGSIFAVVVGLYEKMMDSINHFKTNKKASFQFLLPIVIGAAIGILASTKMILWVCVEYPIQSYLFFVGLVLGSFPLVLKKMKKIQFKPSYLIVSLVSFLLILALTKMGEGGSESYIAIQSFDSWDDAFSMLFAGAFSMSLMSVPGVSGSIMLMVINQYGTVYNAVGQFVDLLFYLLKGDFTAANAAFGSVLLLIPFILGSVIGVILIAKLMGYLLKKYESLVYYGVAGVMVSALITLFETGVFPYWSTETATINPLLLVVIGIICLVIGVVCTLFLDSPSTDQDS
ncbi:DUF368 domain-containing protein [Carnobacterium divergens]|uniref:DUF368 domain-containing protein n=1 Tax=Carnobacterium divergens TaxID=2748 RepID=UPI001072DB4E|nr:DUF368 domain-containing protein [Carnobacterium divergens]TFI70980.1 DUF368 domain-containing protein [Carnobacterium divergens]